MKFGELVIEQRPASLVRRKGASAEEQRASSNAYMLAFSLYSPQQGCYLSGVQLGTTLELKNSYHTLSESEKVFRRVINPARNPKPKAPPKHAPAPVGTYADAAAAAAAAAALSLIHI